LGADTLFVGASFSQLQIKEAYLLLNFIRRFQHTLAWIFQPMPTYLLSFKRFF